MFKRLILSITFLLHHKSLSKIFPLKQEVGIKTKTRRDIGKMYRKQTRRNEENIFDHIFLKSRFNNDKMSCDQQHATSGWTRYSLCFKYRLYSNISLRDGFVVTWIAFPYHQQNILFSLIREKIRILLVTLSWFWTRSNSLSLRSSEKKLA